MAFQRTIKLAAAAALAFSLAGCSSSEDTTPASVLVPTGAPALATIGLDEDTATVEYVEGQDVLVSELNKKDGDYDVIIAPINVGVKAWDETETYYLDGIVTWGNLYVVGTEEDWNVEGNTVAAFGEGAVPSLVFNEVFPELYCDVVYYPSAAEASQALISGSVNTALLAQPVAAAAMSKVDGAVVQDDMQKLWQDTTNSSESGYPQAALFVKSGSEEKAKKVIEEIKDFTESATTDEIETKVEEIGADTLGVPSAAMAASTWSAQNIHYKAADTVSGDITTFLGIFDMELPDGLIPVDEE